MKTITITNQQAETLLMLLSVHVKGQAATTNALFEQARFMTDQLRYSEELTTEAQEDHDAFLAYGELSDSIDHDLRSVIAALRGAE